MDLDDILSTIVFGALCVALLVCTARLSDSFDRMAALRAARAAQAAVGASR